MSWRLAVQLRCAVERERAPALLISERLREAGILLSSPERGKGSVIDLNTGPIFNTDRADDSPEINAPVHAELQRVHVTSLPR